MKKKIINMVKKIKGSQEPVMELGRKYAFNLDDEVFVMHRNRVRLGYVKALGYLKDKEFGTVYYSITLDDGDVLICHALEMHKEIEGLLKSLEEDYHAGCLPF